MPFRKIIDTYLKNDTWIFNAIFEFLEKDYFTMHTVSYFPKSGQIFLIAQNVPFYFGVEKYPGAYPGGFGAVAPRGH